MTAQGGDSQQSECFIYGTCVSRDAFEHEGAPPLATYVARSSLASAFAPVPSDLNDFNLEGNPSAFQRRMLEADVYKKLPKLLREVEFGTLILDLIDERFNLRIVGDSVITQSVELSRCMPAPKPEEIITTGSPEHKRRFSEGLDALLNIVDPDRIVLNRVYWSEVDEAGVEFSNPALTAFSNLLLDEFYEMCRVRGITKTLDYSPELLAASTNHKWGRSPYHYTDAFYAATLEQLASIEKR